MPATAPKATASREPKGTFPPSSTVTFGETTNPTKPFGPIVA